MLQEVTLMKRIVFAAICALSLSGVVAYAAQKGGAEPTAAKNLQVLPKTIPMKELKALMKAQAKELGVQCDFCHDTDDFSKDTDMKKTGRWMMTLVGTINKQFQGKDMVNCGTCHNGHQMPEQGGKDLEKAKAEAAAKQKK